MKREIDTLDATPSKRLFHSIIADYDFNKSVCELIDNALDVWVRNGRKKKILIRITLDTIQQRIIVSDNAGGLAKEDLRYVVGPGQTGTKPTDKTIGIFGVGTKRAVVALAQDIKISTRRLKGDTFQVDLDDAWLHNDDWELPVYKVDTIPPGTTTVDLRMLRKHITEEVITKLKDHLETTYGKFLVHEHVAIQINGERLSSRFFENWAFPPKYPPTRYKGTLTTEDGQDVTVEAIAGLSRESSPATGEYGVYFYCNDRLISRALKSFDVGFTKGLAGLPHPKVSLTRVIVSLNGDARAMPWNSSKSDINTSHPVFVALRDWLIQVVKDYASLSRIWMGDWPTKVFAHKTGKVKTVPVADFPTAKKSFLPPLPKSRPRYGDLVTKQNRKIAHQKPWVKGLYEGIVATDLIFKQRLDQKNRIALIILDSTLEIAFKEYLVNESGSVYADSGLLKLFANRSEVQKEVKKYVTTIDGATWGKINHFYRLRCKLVHERATVGIGDNEVSDFRKVVEDVLRKLYKLRFSRK